MRSAADITADWDSNERWANVERAYMADDVVRLRGPVAIEHSLARRGAEKLWCLIAAESRGYTATKHQREVGTGYFDEVSQVVSGGTSSTTALAGPTGESQF